MSKFNSRFSHLRINIGNDDVRNMTEKQKSNLFRDANTYRVQSPKNIYTLTNRPVQVNYTSPMTTKNEDKKSINNHTNLTNTAQNLKYIHSGINLNLNNYNSPTLVNPNFSIATSSCGRNLTDKLEYSAKVGKPNLINLIKSNLKPKTLTSNSNYNINHTSKNDNLNNSNKNHYVSSNTNTNSDTNRQSLNGYNNNINNEILPANYNCNNNYLSNNIPFSKSSNVTKDKDIECKEKHYNGIINNNDQNLQNHLNNNNLKCGNILNSTTHINHKNSIFAQKNSLNGNNVHNNIASENIIDNYDRNSSLYLRTEGNIANKSNFRNNSDKILNGINNINNSNNNADNDVISALIMKNPLSAKRDAFIQNNNFIKSDRNIKSLNPNIRFESDFSSETNKKLQIKNSLKVFNRLNNVKNSSNKDDEADYKERVIHTDVVSSNNYTARKSDKPDVIDIMKLMSANQPPISLNVLNKKFENFENSKYSTKSLKYIKAYSANTHQGTVRNYNEDRVSIILNVVKPNSFTGDYWPKISIFGIYDGHGGAKCADFLRDHLHQYVIRNHYFPKNPREAIIEGFENAEKDYLMNYALDKNEEVIERSGSCALIMFIIDDTCHIANTGDSRSILSRNMGQKIEQLTQDHKPNQKSEEIRIINAGGKVYQTQTPTQNINLSVLQNSFNIDINSISNNHVIVGPSRVFPGRLSVSRSFGDVEAKLVKFGGLPGVIVPTPEVTSFKIDSDIDFLVLGCDGIYDQLSNKDIINSIWMTTQDIVKLDDIHQQCSLANDFIIKSCLNRKCLDNITLVIIAFENFEKIFSYPVLHTYEDQPISKKVLGDSVLSTRIIQHPNFDKISKIRSESHKVNNQVPSSKGTRPKIININSNLFRQEETSFNHLNQPHMQNLINQNSIYRSGNIINLNNNIINQRNLFHYKMRTPMNSTKRQHFFENTNIKTNRGILNFGNYNPSLNEKARLLYNNTLSINANSEDKKNISYNADRENLNNSNYHKFSSETRKISRIPD